MRDMKKADLDFFFFSSRRRHTRYWRDWSSDVCSSDLVVLTGAGDRAFSVGSDLRQRRSMTKEDWLRQRQAFDRTLYTVRQLRKPVFAAVNGIAYGCGFQPVAKPHFFNAAAEAPTVSP